MVRSTAPEPTSFRRLPLAEAFSQIFSCALKSFSGCAPGLAGRSIIFANVSSNVGV